MNSIEVLQSVCRGYLTRSKFIRLKDGMNFDLLLKCLKAYKFTISQQNEVNKLLKKKKIRRTNFPESISENIVKFAFFKNYNIMPNWDTKVGDLELDIGINKPEILKIEVKGALDLNNGPSSFGPKEKWDIIYFIDAKYIFDNIFKIYEIKLSNESILWKKLEVSDKVTWEDFVKTGKRPRMNFTQIQKQLPNKYIKTLFNGNIMKLNPHL